MKPASKEVQVIVLMTIHDSLQHLDNDGLTKLEEMIAHLKWFNEREAVPVCSQEQRV